MRRLALSLALLAFFLNPGFACTPSDEPQFKYGEPEMKAAVEGTWLLTLRASDGTLSETTLQIAESSKAQAMMSPAGGGSRSRTIRSAMACGTRTFVKSAGACMDVSEMPLEVAVAGGDPRFQGASASGTLRIASLIFTQGMLDLKLGDFWVVFAIAPDGTTSAPNGGSADVAVVSLVRTAP